MQLLSHLSFPDIDFTNILCKAFTLADLQKHKKDSQTIGLFAALGSERVKAELKMLVKSTLGNMRNEIQGGRQENE